MINLEELNRFELCMLQQKLRVELAHRGVVEINQMCVELFKKKKPARATEMVLARLNNEVRKAYPNYSLVEELTELLTAILF